MPAATIIGNGRAQVQAPIDAESLLYTPVPDGSGGYTDNWAKLKDVMASLEHAYSYITNVESPYSGATLINHLINTTGGQVEFQLPASPSPNQKFRLAPAASTYETNSLIIRRNGNPIGGVDDDVEINQNGVAVELVYIDATYGWAILERGDTMVLQRVTLQGADITSKRTSNNTTVTTSPSDLETLVITTSDTNGDVELFDSSQVSDLFQMSFVQQGAGSMTFTLPQGSSDTILALDDAVTTAGPGALVQVIKLAAGLWFITGGLI